MMQEIKDYVLVQCVGVKRVSSIPYKRTYRSYLRTSPQIKFTVEIIQFGKIHACYKNLAAQGKKIKYPFLLLKEIFFNPSSPAQIVFVQQQWEGLRSLASLSKGQLSFDRILLLILRTIRLVPIVFANGVLHDFHVEKVKYDNNDDIFLQKFANEANPRIRALTIQDNINEIIRTLIGNNIKMEWVNDIRFQIKSEEVCWLKIQYQPKDESFPSRSIIKFIFSPQGQTLTYTQENSIEQAFSKNISYEQLRDGGDYVFSLIKYGRKATLEKKEGNKININPENLLGGQEEKVSYPYSLVGLIESRMTDNYNRTQKFYGTGILLSEYLVVTCAHNLIKYAQGSLYRLLDTKNLRFKLHDTQYHEVQDFRMPEQYKSSKGNAKYLYDYALLKLKDPVYRPKYIQVTKNYEKSEDMLIIAGRYKKDNNQILPGTALCHFFSMEQGQIKFECIPNIQIQKGAPENKQDEDDMVNQLSPGFSGSPIILISNKISSIDNFFMIGIFFGRISKEFFANRFKDENISNFGNWEMEMTHQKKVFERVLSFETLLWMYLKYRNRQNVETARQFLAIMRQRNYPFNLVGVVQSRMTKKYNQVAGFEGSGVLVSKYLVVTCAHNLIMHREGILYRVMDVRDISFKLNGIYYEVQSYRMPTEYNQRSERDAYRLMKYNYTLLKLREPIRMPKYIQVIKNYDRRAGKLLIAGNYRNNNEMVPRTAFFNYFRFEQGFIKFFCPSSYQPPARQAYTLIYPPGYPFRAHRGHDQSDQLDLPRPGSAGSPIILVAGEVNNRPEYCFMVGTNLSNVRFYSQGS